MTKNTASIRRDHIQAGLLAVVLVLLFANLALYLKLQRIQRDLNNVMKTVDENLAKGASVGLTPGTPAPDFWLVTYQGGEISLSQYAGVRLLLVFIALDCEACARVYPLLRKAKSNHPEMETLIVAHGPVPEVEKLMEAEGMDAPLVAWSDDLANDYKVPGTPFATLIDTQGSVLGAQFVGYASTFNALLNSAAPVADRH